MSSKQSNREGTSSKQYQVNGLAEATIDSMKKDGLKVKRQERPHEIGRTWTEGQRFVFLERLIQ